MLTKCVHNWRFALDYECVVCQQKLLQWIERQARLQARSDSDAQDIGQEVMDELYRRRNWDPDRAALTTFLRRMITSRAATFYRASGRLAAREDRAGRIMASTGQTGEETFRSLEADMAFDKALEELDPIVAEAVRLFYYDGLTVAAITRQLGCCSEVTWAARIKRSTEHIARRLYGL